MGVQVSQSYVSVDCLPCLHLLDAFTEGVVQPLPFFLVEVVTAAGEHLVEGHQIDDLAIGQIGRLVDDDAPVLHVRFEG